MRRLSSKKTITSRFVALGLGLFICGALALPNRAARAEGDAPSAEATKTKTTKAQGKAAKTAKAAKTTSRSSKSSKKKVARPPESTEPPALAKRRRIGATPAYVVGDSDPHLINESAPPLEAFPTDGKAVKKAFSETRRDQLVDAEKAARDAKTPDRWRTVLFMLRGLPERTDSEACFWRVLSFYRLGENARARTLREACELPPKDSGTLNEEDARSAGIPQMGTVAREDDLGAPQGATNAKAEVPATAAAIAAAAPYAGPSPQRR